MNTYSIKSETVSETLAIGEKLGAQLMPGDVIEFRSDLGGGKTTMAGGIVAGLGSDDSVSSPSFTICNTYTGRESTLIYHFDFYRLDQPGIIAQELEEALIENRSIVLVEWGNIVASVLPEQKIVVSIESNSDIGRIITIDAPRPLKLGKL